MVNKLTLDNKFINQI